MPLPRLALRAALACAALAVEPARAQGRRPPPPVFAHRPPPSPPFTPPAILSGLKLSTAFPPRQLLFLDRCPGACTAEIEDLATVRVTISVRF